MRRNQSVENHVLKLKLKIFRYTLVILSSDFLCLFLCLRDLLKLEAEDMAREEATSEAQKSL